MSGLRPLDLDALALAKGSHPANDGLCVMEAVAFVAGEPHSDSPTCACPVVGTFLRYWNDGLDDAARQRLKVFVPRLIGSKASRAVEVRRAWLATDWLVRVYTPAWLRLAKLEEQAVALESLPEMTARSAEEEGDAVNAATRAAKSTAWDAASENASARALATARAPWTVAWIVAESAVESAAGDAARATATAWSAASVAAWADAVWHAAREAAWSVAMDSADSAAGRGAVSAARNALSPTVLFLQDSALQLVERMLQEDAEEEKE